MWLINSVAILLNHDVPQNPYIYDVECEERVLHKSFKMSHEMVA